MTPAFERYRSRTRKMQILFGAALRAAAFISFPYFHFGSNRDQTLNAVWGVLVVAAARLGRREIELEYLAAVL